MTNGYPFMDKCIQSFRINESGGQISILFDPACFRDNNYMAVTGIRNDRSANQFPDL